MNTDNPKRVRSRKALAKFVRGLADDLKQHPEQWENVDLYDYLEAMSAWIADMHGAYKNRGEVVPSQPEWRTLAEILSAARIYE